MDLKNKLHFDWSMDLGIRIAFLILRLGIIFHALFTGLLQ